MIYASVEIDTGVKVFQTLVSLFPLVLIFIGLFTGRYFEKKHLEYLDQAEAELKGIVVTNMKSPTGEVDITKCSSIVGGQVVIASDALKSFLAGFRTVFGGEMKSYEALMNRARREATVRMLSDARQAGFNAVCNLRIDFSSIKSGGRNGAGAVEVLVTATAYRIDCQ